MVIVLFMAGCCLSEAKAEGKGTDKEGVPALLKMLQHPNKFIASMAPQALKRVDPEAALKAGVK